MEKQNEINSTKSYYQMGNTVIQTRVRLGDKILEVMGEPQTVFAQTFYNLQPYSDLTVLPIFDTIDSNIPTTRKTLATKFKKITGGKGIFFPQLTCGWSPPDFQLSELWHKLQQFCSTSVSSEMANDFHYWLLDPGLQGPG